MQADMQIVSLLGREETEQQSGVKLVLEEETTALVFGDVASSRTREQFGRVELTLNGKGIYDGTVKLWITSKHPKKLGGVGTRKLTLVLDQRVDAKEFGKLFGHVGVTLGFQFWRKAEQVPAGDGRPHADDPEDDNVVPGSVAADKKANARKAAKKRNAPGKATA